MKARPCPLPRRIPRRSLALAEIALLLALPATVLAGAVTETTPEGAVLVRNEASPRDGVETWTLREAWRAGGEDDDVFFGVVNDAVVDPDSNVYLLDGQLSQVFVYSAEGEFLRTLAREGDGPGEVRRPALLALWPDGSLGILQRFPGQVVRVNADDTPAGSFIPRAEGASGGMMMLSELRLRDGVIAVGGMRMRPQDGGMERTYFLAYCDEEGVLQDALFTKTRLEDPNAMRFVEREEFFPNRQLWTMGPGGRLYAVPERDRFAVNVYDPDGTLLRVIERPYDPWPRTERDKAEIAEGVIAVVNGQRIQLETEIEDRAPAILRTWVSPAGELWVLGSRGDREQAEGVFVTFDVFDEEGIFVRQVALACPGDPRNDRLLLLDDGRFVLIRNFTDARDGMFGGDGEAEGEEAPLEVICLERA